MTILKNSKIHLIESWLTCVTDICLKAVKCLTVCFHAVKKLLNQSASMILQILHPDWSIWPEALSNTEVWGCFLLKYYPSYII